MYLRAECLRSSSTSVRTKPSHLMSLVWSTLQVFKALSGFCDGDQNDAVIYWTFFFRKCQIDQTLATKWSESRFPPKKFQSSPSGHYLCGKCSFLQTFYYWVHTLLTTYFIPLWTRSLKNSYNVKPLSFFFLVVSHLDTKKSRSESTCKLFGSITYLQCLQIKLVPSA